MTRKAFGAEKRRSREATTKKEKTTMLDTISLTAQTLEK
jgi:hypothetical protein